VTCRKRCWRWNSTELLIIARKLKLMQWDMAWPETLWPLYQTHDTAADHQKPVCHTSRILFTRHKCVTQHLSIKYFKTVSLDATPSKCMPPPQKCTWSRYDLDLWPVTLKTFSARDTHIAITCTKFHCNPSAE